MSATATPSRAPGAALLASLRARPVLATAAGLALLAGISLALRTQALDAKLWIDEGLSIGIAKHGLTEIPSVLRQDGSPPLYYLLLHLWIEVIGDGEARSHALSLLFSLAAIPGGWFAGRALFGVRAAWACAALAAFNPYLTYYAQETRMYSLAALLSLAVCTAFALAFGLRRRRALPAFAVLGALLAYTHNWGLFLLGGAALAVLVLVVLERPEERRPLVRDGVLAFGGAFVLYLPWVPSLLSQAMHTGAPWAERPGLNAVVNGFTGVLGGEAPAAMGGFVAIAGLVAVVRAGWRRPERAEGPPPAPGDARVVLVLVLMLVLGTGLAFLASQISPAWATRYLAVFVSPLLLLFAVGLTRKARTGLVALGLVLLLWTDGRERELRGKSNAFKVATMLEEKGYVTQGDLVLNTHPEQGPLMRYYLGDGLRWANALGPVRDPWVFDWRDALEEFEQRGPISVSRRVLGVLEPGQDLILVQPIIRSGKWGAPWTRLVRERAAAWQRTLDRTEGLRRVEPVPRFGDRRVPRGVRAVVYRRGAGPLVLPPPPPPAPPAEDDSEA